ncbi:hypothetical protein NOS3756_47310 [Nostoc sp. NIES-3756]|uniref:hypothetical protein n=1 Tax=Nostoc sp. NIES-3756 TaxID=1751286 RepID=UPI00072303B5|nr:hypothetical protein [Nostoc sp. NIES-3756]BAT55738.1 hypothetical protein NOS3756_47310 [Nostoc sp. NIES-3756]
MSTQMITSDLLEELSAEQQQLLSGGQNDGQGGDSETSVDEDGGGGGGEDSGFYTGTKRFQITTRSIVSIRRLPSFR